MLPTVGSGAGTSCKAFWSPARSWLTSTSCSRRLCGRTALLTTQPCDLATMLMWHCDNDTVNFITACPPPPQECCRDTLHKEITPHPPHQERCRYTLHKGTIVHTPKLLKLTCDLRFAFVLSAGARCSGASSLLDQVDFAQKSENKSLHLLLLLLLPPVFRSVSTVQTLP